MSTFGGQALKKIVVLGAGGLASEVLNLLEENNDVTKEWEILGCLDANYCPEAQRQILGYPVLGTDVWLAQFQEPIHAVCAIGNPDIRKKIISNCLKINPNVVFPPIIHHRAQVSKHSKIGNGSIICSGVIITVDIKIGPFSIINLGVSIGHGSSIGEFSTLHPSTTICGNVTIAPGSEIGTGTTIIPNIYVGAHSVLGAGSVVVRDIPDGVVAYGNPCRVMRER